MSKSITRRTALKGALVSSAVLAAPAIGRAQALEPLSVMTPFGYIGDFIDLMNAASGGHFKRYGFDAKVLGGHGTAQAIQQLTAGSVQYARSASIDMMRAVGGPQPIPLIAISTLYQASTFQVISPADKPVKTAAELKGRTVGVVSVGGSTEILLNLMLLKAGIKPGEVKREVTGNSPGALQIVRQGRVDCFIASMEVVAALQRTNEKIAFWSTDKYAPMPGQCYITTRDEAEHHGERAVRFLRAMRDSIDELMTQPLKPIYERAAKDFEIAGIRNIDALVENCKHAQSLWLAQGRQNLLRNVPALWEDGAKELTAAGLAQLPDAKILYTNTLIEKALAG